MEIRKNLLFINKIIFLATSLYLLTENTFYKSIFIHFTGFVKNMPLLGPFLNLLEHLNNFVLIGPMCIVLLSLFYPESKILNMIANFFALSCSLITTVIMIQKGIWLDSINLGLFKIYNTLTFEEKRKLFEFYLSQIGPTYPPSFSPFIREKINSTFETKIMYNLSSLERSGIEPYVSKLLNEWWNEFKNIHEISKGGKVSNSWGAIVAKTAVITGSIALIGYGIYKWFFAPDIVDLAKTTKSLVDATQQVNNNVRETNQVIGSMEGAMRDLALETSRVVIELEKEIGNQKDVIVNKINSDGEILNKLAKVVSNQTKSLALVKADVQKLKGTFPSSDLGDFETQIKDLERNIEKTNETIKKLSTSSEETLSLVGSIIIDLRGINQSIEKTREVTLEKVSKLISSEIAEIEKSVNTAKKTMDDEIVALVAANNRAAEAKLFEEKTKKDVKDLFDASKEHDKKFEGIDSTLRYIKQMEFRLGIEPLNERVVKMEEIYANFKDCAKAFPEKKEITELKLSIATLEIKWKKEIADIKDSVLAELQEIIVKQKEDLMAADSAISRRLEDCIKKVDALSEDHKSVAQSVSKHTEIMKKLDLEKMAEKAEEFSRQETEETDENKGRSPMFRLFVDMFNPVKRAAMYAANDARNINNFVKDLRKDVP